LLNSDAVIAFHDDEFAARYEALVNQDIHRSLTPRFSSTIDPVVSFRTSLRGVAVCQRKY
jgi:hypothetical protein